VNQVEVSRLHVRYPSFVEEDRKWVLEDISFSADRGEFIILSGFSGVGKSTLLYVLNGVASRLYNAEIEGRVIVAGTDLSDLEMGDISRMVGSVLQDSQSQIFNLKVDDELAFGCENLGLPRDMIHERVIRFAGLMGLELEQIIAHMSGGEIQRLASAAVLAMDQDLLLLDEPLANLDVDSAKDLLSYLKKASLQGKTVILVEHRLDVVLPYCTRLLWMEDGRLVDDLTQQEGIQKYASLFQAGSLRIKSRERNPLVTITQAAIGYGKELVLEDVDLTIGQGEALVILGENGSGKTTLLRALGKLTRPIRGSIEHSFDPSNGQEPPEIGYVYQNPNYMLFMDSVYKEVAFQSGSQENTERFLALFNIEHLRDRHPLSLSEGQKRLVTIAAAAAMKPKLLLLDEPTVGQDFQGLERLLKTLEIMHQEQDTCVVLVTHDYRCASAFGDRVLWLENGKVKADGSSDLVDAYFQRYLE
jgi:energy-coupling factor transport system ATP-binding protein